MQELKEKAARAEVDQVGPEWARKRSDYIKMLTKIFKEEYGEQPWSEGSEEEAEKKIRC